MAAIGENPARLGLPDSVSSKVVVTLLRLSRACLVFSVQSDGPCQAISPTHSAELVSSKGAKARLKARQYGRCRKLSELSRPKPAKNTAICARDSYRTERTRRSGKPKLVTTTEHWCGHRGRILSHGLHQARSRQSVWLEPS